MRLLTALAFFFVASRLMAGPTPPELEAALKEFRTEGSKSWAFTQTTAGDGKKLVERYDPRGKNFLHWTLLETEGRAPTKDETDKYNQRKTSRSSNEHAPNVKDQIAPGSCEVISETPERGVYQFTLNPADSGDSGAKYWKATFTLHRPTKTIEQVEMHTTEAFRPVMMVKVEEARTVITYTLPEGDRPTLLQNITVKVRASSWFGKRDQDLTVAYSDYAYAGKK